MHKRRLFQIEFLFVNSFLLIILNFIPPNNIVFAQLVRSKDQEIVRAFVKWTNFSAEFLKNPEFNGLIPAATQFPQIVSLSIKYTDDNISTSTTCSGILVSLHQILTAAHCVCGPNPFSGWFFDTYAKCDPNLKNLTIKAYLPTSGIITLQSLPIVHKNYRVPSEGSHGHEISNRADIALLSLPHSIEIKPVSLAKSINQSLVEQKTRPIFASYGTLSFSDVETGSSIYRRNTSYHAGIRQLSKQKDFRINPKHCGPLASSDIFCTTYNDESIPEGPSMDAGACEGDSGGPLLDWEAATNETTILGVASYISRSNCTTSRTTFFIDIIKYNDWISKILELPTKTTFVEPVCVEAPFIGPKEIEIIADKGQLSATAIHAMNEDKPIFTITSANELHCNEFENKSVISCKLNSDDNKVQLKIDSGAAHVIFCKTADKEIQN